VKSLLKRTGIWSEYVKDKGPGPRKPKKRPAVPPPPKAAAQTPAEPAPPHAEPSPEEAAQAQPTEA
jgi:hypothetical protein